MDTRFLEILGDRLEIARIDPPTAADRPQAPWSGPVLVFLHEALGSVAGWRDFPAEMVAATGLPALVYSRAGHGRSSPPQHPRTPGYLDVEAITVLPAVLHACAVTHPILFGHSDGATIALIYAACAVEPPLGLIIEAPHIVVEPVTLAGIKAAMARWDDDPTFAEKLSRYHDDAPGIFAAWHRIWLHSDHREWAIENRLPAIISPILQIQGSDDAYGTDAQLTAIARQSSARVETLWLQDVGHVPHGKAPDAVITASIRFIQSLPRPA